MAGTPVQFAVEPGGGWDSGRRGLVVDARLALAGYRARTSGAATPRRARQSVWALRLLAGCGGSLAGDRVQRGHTIRRTRGERAGTAPGAPSPWSAPCRRPAGSAADRDLDCTNQGIPAPGAV